MKIHALASQPSPHMSILCTYLFRPGLCPLVNSASSTFAPSAFNSRSTPQSLPGRCKPSREPRLSVHLSRLASLTLVVPSTTAAASRAGGRANQACNGRKGPESSSDPPPLSDVEMPSVAVKRCVLKVDVPPSEAASARAVLSTPLNWTDVSHLPG